jgi:hypothetical protein
MGNHLLSYCINQQQQRHNCLKISSSLRAQRSRQQHTKQRMLLRVGKRQKDAESLASKHATSRAHALVRFSFVSLLQPCTKTCWAKLQAHKSYCVYVCLAWATRCIQEDPRLQWQGGPPSSRARPCPLKYQAHAHKTLLHVARMW